MGSRIRRIGWQQAVDHARFYYQVGEPREGRGISHVVEMPVRPDDAFDGATSDIDSILLENIGHVVLDRHLPAGRGDQLLDHWREVLPVLATA